MFKRVFSFILIMVMSICTITANAKNVYFATHRVVTNEYGEDFPKSAKEAYCPTRIELDVDAKTILIKTRTHGTASYTFSNIVLKDQGVVFFDGKGEVVGGIVFLDTDYSEFGALQIFRKDNTKITYMKIE